ncbi:hypothetical protein Tco_0409903 [Tanacetum coccineum]
MGEIVRFLYNKTHFSEVLKAVRNNSNISEGAKQSTISKSKAKKSKPAPAKPKEKKRKPVSESSEAQPLSKRARAGKVVKKRTVKSSKQLVDEFVDEGVPAAKPSLEDTEEAIMQKVLEESLTDAYPTQRGPLPPVVFRETDTGKFQPLPEVPGKGKEKVGEEQAAQVLLNLQTPKKKSSAEQYIFQRRAHSPTKTAVVRSKAQDEGQAGPNPDDVAESLPLPTPCVLAGPNLEHSDVEITDPSSQPQPEHMDEGFTATAYPDVQENLKLTVDEQVLPEEPVSSTGTLSSLQHLAKDFSFGDQFLNDKPSEADNEKTTADTEAESMVSVTIQQDTSIIPPMTSPVIDLVSRPVSPNVHWPLPTTTTTTAAPTTTTTTTTLPLPPQPQQGSSDSILIKRMGELEQHIANLADENQALETRLDKQGNRIHKVETMDLTKMIREQTVEFINTQDIDRKINETVKEVENYDKCQLRPERAYEAMQGYPSWNECGTLMMIWLRRKLEEVAGGNLSLKTDRTSEPCLGTIPSSDSVYANKIMGTLLSIDNMRLQQENLSTAQTGDLADHLWMQCHKFLRSGLMHSSGTTSAAISIGRVNRLVKPFKRTSSSKKTGKSSTIMVARVRRPALSISKMKAAYYPDVGLENNWIKQMELETLVLVESITPPMLTLIASMYKDFMTINDYQNSFRNSVK